MQQLKDGGDFTALAKKYSTDTSTSALGGRLPGGITTGQTLPAFDRAAFSLKTNEISAPVQTQYGWHVIQPTSDVDAGDDDAARPGELRDPHAARCSRRSRTR